MAYWACAQVAPLQERAAQHFLGLHGFESYCPRLRIVRRRPGGRQIVTKPPLFPSYVFVAIVAGWVTTETGRQPYTVYGLLTTAQSASPVAAPALSASLAAFVIVYFALFGMGVYYMLKLINRPPAPHEPSQLPPVPSRAAGITPAQAIKSGAIR